MGIVVIREGTNGLNISEFRKLDTAALYAALERIFGDICVFCICLFLLV
jgi:hypothetical protein